MEIKYYSNLEKGCVVCKIKCREGSFNGKAKCHPEDSFNIKTGEQIAYKKALIKLKKYDKKELMTLLHEANMRVEKIQKQLKSIDETILNIKEEITNLS